LPQETCFATFVGMHRGDAPGGQLDSARSRRALTLVELLVTFAIVSILLSILLPGLSQAQAVARRIVCAAHESSIGIALTLDADQNSQKLVESWFAQIGRPSETMAATRGYFDGSFQSITAPIPNLSPDGRRWDGLGKLGYKGTACLDSPEALFCPCHRGDHAWEVERDCFVFDAPTTDETKRYFTNYQYSGHLEKDGDRRSLARLSNADVLVADGFRTRDDVNHETGANVLRGDLSVKWWAANRFEFESLPVDSFSESVSDTAWIDPVYNPWDQVWDAVARER